MSDPHSFVANFNRIEAILWFAAALGLPFVIRSESRKQHLSVLAASFGFFLFGITDLLEAGSVGAIPAWLWTFKIACATLLLSCRFTYLGWKNFKPTDRWVLFGLFCLAASAVLIALGRSTPEI